MKQSHFVQKHGQKGHTKENYKEFERVDRGVAREPCPSVCGRNRAYRKQQNRSDEGDNPVEIYGFTLDRKSGLEDEQYQVGDYGEGAHDDCCSHL